MSLVNNLAPNIKKMYLDPIRIKNGLWPLILITSRNMAVFHLQSIVVVLHLPNFEVVFHWTKYFGRLPFAKSCLSFTKLLICLLFSMRLRSSFTFQNIEVVFHSPNYWDCLPYPKILMSSSISQSKRLNCLPWWKIKVVLKFPEKNRLSSICEKIKVVFHLYGYLVKLCWIQAFSLLFRVAGRSAQQMLDIAKIKVTSD